MMLMWTMAFWKGAGERAVKAFAWTLSVLLAGPAAGGAVGVDLLHVGWRDAASFAAGAALLSVLASITGNGLGVGPAGSPSLVDDRPTPAELEGADRP
jgi:hypothetical protein